MKCQPQQALFRILAKILHAVANVQKEFGFFHRCISGQHKNRPDLRSHKDSLTAVTRMSQLKRPHRLNPPLVVHSLIALPGDLGERRSPGDVKLTVHWIRHRAVFRQLANPDVPVGDRITVVLQTDMPLRSLAKLRELCKLAGRNSPVPVVAAYVEVVIADSVDRDFTLLRGHSQIHMVPFPGRSRGIIHVDALETNLVFELHCPLGLLRLVQLIQPASLLRVATVNIVLHLHLRSRSPRPRIVLGHPKHDPTVATLCNPVLERQFEVLILLCCDDVTGT